jgi:hypothetical protein
MYDALNFVLILIAESWPVWLFGGMACLVWWLMTEAWRPVLRVVARSFLLAIVLTPTRGPVPAISVFYHEGTDEWFMRGILPLLLGWLAILILFLMVADFKRAVRR